MTREIITFSTHAKGGIRSVVENYLETDLYKEYTHTWIHSHDDKNVVIKQLMFVNSILALIKAKNRRNCIAHIHMAMKGSFLRKGIILRLAKALKIKTILHLHGSEFKDFYYGSNLTIQKLISRTFTKADKVIVLSNSWQEFILKISPSSNIQVINNFVNQVPHLSCSKEKGTKYFLFLGALGKRKGIHDLIPAFAELSKISPDIKLKIGGNGDIDELQLLCRAHNIESKVDFLGWVVGEEKNQLLNECDTLVLPSYNEGLPMVILEAFSLGKCVISTNVGGIPEVVVNDKTGFLIEPGRKEELVNALKSSLDDNKRKIMGKHAQELFSQRFSADAIVPKLNRIYSELS